MFKNAKTVVLIPDEPGRGGMKTAVTSQSKIFDTHVIANCNVFMGRWSTTTQPWQSGIYANPAQMGRAVTADAISQAIYNFASIDTTNATLAPSNHLMEHLYDDGIPAIENIILDHSVFSNAAQIAWSANSGGNNYCVPATMISIRNRCFICWGGNTSTVPVTHVGGATMTVNNIIYDPNNAVSVFQYDIGVLQPMTAPTYTLGGTATGTTSVTNGSNKVNNATVSGNWSGSTLGITIGGVPYNVVSPGGYSTTFTTAGTMQAITAGTSTCTINGFSFPVNGDWNGLTIGVAAPNAESHVISSYSVAGGNTTVTIVGTWSNNHALSVAYTVSGEELVLTTAYGGATSLSQSYVSGSGALSWTGIGPQYAYAYYDPNTGHVSNVSPIMQVTEQNIVGANVVLTNIARSLNTDYHRFTKILIFRTLASQGGISGGVLYPIGDGSGGFDVTTTNGNGGTTSYTDTAPDTKLLVNSGLQAPLTTNRRPVGPIAHMMYWDGRIWANPVSDPTAVYFSCDTVQCPFGIPEESFPSQNLLRIPAEDGKVTGMKLVGSLAVITTNRFSYYVSGNNELNYRPLRFASTTNGVSDYQMSEFAGDTADNSASLVYLGGDGRIYMNSQSYGNVSLSDPVDDVLLAILGNNQALFSATRVVPVAVGLQKYLLVSIPFSTTDRFVMLYDFNRKVWSRHSPGSALTGNPSGNGYPFSSFTSVYQTPVSQGSSTIIPTDFVMSYQGNIYSWFRPASQSVGVDPAHISTFPFDFGRKSRKQLNEVRIYVNAANVSGWNIQIVTNENTLPYEGTSYTPILNPDPIYRLQGGFPVTGSVSGSPFPIDAVDARELVVFLPQDATDAVIGNRFTFQVNFPTANVQTNISGTNPYQLYAVHIVYTDLDPQDVESP